MEINKKDNAQSYKHSGLSPTDASDSYSYVASCWNIKLAINDEIKNARSNILK